MITDSNDDRLDYSVVIPVFNNEGSLSSTFESLRTAVIDRNKKYRGEIVFVDDGSVDRSLEELGEISREFPDNVRVIEFTRNFGQTAAIQAGLDHARGECAVVISADGQEQAERCDRAVQGQWSGMLPNASG